MLFVCVKNGGKSQLAAGLMKHEAGNAVEVLSAGTNPGPALNTLAVDVLHDLGIDMSGEKPKALTEQTMKEVSLVVVLGSEAKVPDLEGVRVVTWNIDEPSLRGIEGRERMELVRDDIYRRVKALKSELILGK